MALAPGSSGFNPVIDEWLPESLRLARDEICGVHRIAPEDWRTRPSVRLTFEDVAIRNYSRHLQVERKIGADRALCEVASKFGLSENTVLSRAKRTRRAQRKCGAKSTVTGPAHRANVTRESTRNRRRGSQDR